MTALRWLADECVHAPVVASLRAAGHDVVYAAETQRQTPDADLAQQALSDHRILLTEDKDFGELAFREQRIMSGIVLLRLSPPLRELKWSRLEAAIVQYGDALYRSFTVVDENRTRHQAFAAES